MTIQRCSTCGSEQGFYQDKTSGRSRCLACFAPQEETKGKAEAPPKPASGSGVTRSKAEPAPKPASKQPAPVEQARAEPKVADRSKPTSKGKGTATR